MVSDSFHKRLCIFVFACWLVSCSAPEQENSTVPGFAPIEDLDSTFRPQQDFYNYVNAHWLKETKVPDGRTEWSIFSELEVTKDRQLRAIMDTIAARQLMEGSDAYKVRAFYAIGMDSMLAEEKGFLPIMPLLTKLEAVKTKIELQNFLRTDFLPAHAAFFTLNTLPTSGQNRFQLEPAVLGLPQLQDYTQQDQATKTKRARYLQYIERLFELTSSAEPTSAASHVLQIETMLAAERVKATNKKLPVNQLMAIADVIELAPSFRWQNFFPSRSPKIDSVHASKEYLKTCEKVFSMPLENQKNYLRYRVISEAAPYLSHSFVREWFEFNEAYLLGSSRLPGRHQRVMEKLILHLGDVVGRYYVKHYVPADKLENVKEMVMKVRLTFADRIKEMNFINDSTKQKSLQRLKDLTVHVGQPEKWKTYVDLEVRDDPATASYYENMMLANKFKVRAKNVLPDSPLSVFETKLIFDEAKNELFVPAALLQPPLFDSHGTIEANLGTLGAEIARVMAADCLNQMGGTLAVPVGRSRVPYLSPEEELYSQLLIKLGQQKNSYQGLKSSFTTVALQDIANQLGTAVALETLKRYQRENGQSPGLAGFTPEQIFFISVAKGGRVQYRDDDVQYPVKQSMARYKIEGALMNLPDFQSQMSVQPTDRLFRKDTEMARFW